MIRSRSATRLSSAAPTSPQRAASVSFVAPPGQPGESAGRWWFAIVDGVLLLITGASGVGKSTVRELVAPELSPAVECVELLQLCWRPSSMSRVWRQQTAEAAVRRAVELHACGRHLLLAGDPRLAGLSPLPREMPVPGAKQVRGDTGWPAWRGWVWAPDEGRGLASPSTLAVVVPRCAGLAENHGLTRIVTARPVRRRRLLCARTRSPVLSILSHQMRVDRSSDGAR